MESRIGGHDLGHAVLAHQYRRVDVMLGLLLAEFTREQIAWITTCSLSAVRGTMSRLAWRLHGDSAISVARQLRRELFGAVPARTPRDHQVTAPKQLRHCTPWA